MLAVLTAVATGVRPAERDYHLIVRSRPGTPIRVQADVPRGWIGAFCTPRICAAGHVVIRIPQSGSSTIALHVYRIDDRSARHTGVLIHDDRGDSLTLPVSF